MNIKKFFKRFRKKKRLPVLYDRNNRPIPPPPNSKRRKPHKYQRPSIFTKSEVDEILEKQSTKKSELKS